MPPGNSNNSNLTNTDENLNQEAIDSLLPKFETHRKSLRCPHCEKMGFFRRNGSTKTDPPTPILRCHGCGKTYKAHTMACIIQSFLSPTNIVNSIASETSGMIHNTQLSPNGRTVDQPNNLQPLLDMIQRLTTELASARAEIDSLRQQMDKLQGQSAQQLSNSRATKSPKEADHLNHDEFPELPSQMPPWHNPIRTRLRKLDIKNNRILDIHYPDRHVVALLVHNDYVNELRAQLERFKITIKDNFDPCDPEILRDPKYADLSTAEPANYALMHHSDRMVRALKYIRVPVKYTVARYFYSKGWISKTTLEETLPNKARSTDQAAEFFHSDDVFMDTADDFFHDSINIDNSTKRDATTMDDSTPI
ncbi:hypothetical protein RO3G_16570 [Rhizopus delemar RA 99-880]|uniref:Uncharacterized protein n=1 Tax=Rhizopus delemar (strain RA 99-880 / ATCC MYA-4621 / FGSC 9543 / NRRL 43880) TaxID=246409 RepID=I1CTS9_RHIO9|nr:hypothetical protein RO3G_16570 [Rhizopus delemar RA 99-880]|eukprot:EIE91859.1 hypothetical protein RO3G_16570 [Rhizopus delemar RA 99-880]